MMILLIILFMPNDIAIERVTFLVCFLKIKEEDNSVCLLEKASGY